jgi:beta-phosphoglucomutase-like phosphatase (HAD superfamily)
MAVAGRQFDGFLFDIDGTLANTDPSHFAVFKELLLAEPSINGGQEIDEQFFRARIAGRQNQLIIADLFPDWDAARGKAWSDRKEERWREYAGATVGDCMMAGLDRLRSFIDARSNGLTHKACAVTNAPRLNAEVILQGIGYRKWFGDRLIIGDECERGKPDPLPYLLGAAKLGVEPSNCIVFEDSPSGATAGKAAGCFVVGVLSGQSRAALEAVGCDLIVRDFDSEDLWALLK